MFISKRFYVLFLVIWQLCSGAALAQIEPIRIVVLGDSLTSGYQLAEPQAFSNVLEQKLLSNGYSVKVINQSIAGRLSNEAYKRYGDVLALNPDILILQLGYNDALREIDPTKQLFTSLYQMSYQSRKRNIGVLIMGVKAPESASFEYRQKMDTVFYRAAVANKATLYPNILKTLQERPDLTLADGLHPNASGVLAIVHDLYPYIEPLVVWRINLQNYKNSIK